MPRPMLNIPDAEVLKFAEEGANNCEIADFFGCDEGTIRRRFANELRMGRALRRMKLRRKQDEVAMEGNPAMLIWLGKNELGQSDKQAIEHTGKDGGPIDLRQLPVDDLRKLREIMAKAHQPTPN